MSKDTNFITMLGTGNALVTRCYNTCFTLHGKEGALHRRGTEGVCGTSLGARRFGKNNIVNTNLTLRG